MLPSPIIEQAPKFPLIMQDTQGRDKQDNRIIVNSVQNEEIQSFLVRNKQYKIFTIYCLKGYFESTKDNRGQHTHRHTKADFLSFF